LEKNKISVIIPTKNEEFTIRQVVEGCKKYADEIIVVDGGSKDKTREVASNSGAKVYFDDAKGKGAALRKGANKARGKILIFIDADGSHEINDMPKLVNTMVENEADLVITSRGRGGSDELHGDFKKLVRLIGSSIITLIINLKFKVHFTDSQNGFRAIQKSTFLGLNLKENYFAIEQEMLMKALSNKKKVVEIPSHEYARKFGESNIKIWKMFPYYFWSLFKGLFY